MNNPQSIFGKEMQPYIETRDFMCTEEVFQIMIDSENDILETRPVPSPADMPKYYISDDYAPHKKKGFALMDSLYRWVRNRQNAYKFHLINRYQPQAERFLDIGAGTGSFAGYVQEKGKRVFAVEPSGEARAIAGKEQPGVRFFADIKDIPPSEKFDVITLWHVLEHIDDLREYLRRIYEMLEKKGYAFLALPNYKSYDAQVYGEYWAAYDVPRHIRHFSRTSIRRLMAETGFESTGVFPLKWDAYYIAMLSETYRSGSKKIPLSLFRGFLSNFKAKKTGEYSSLLYVFKKE